MVDQKLPKEIAERIFDAIPLKMCRRDGADLPKEISYYPHSEGWQVEGISEKIWLTIRCPICGFQYSLWKLGYGRDDSETESMKERIVIWQQLALEERKIRKDRKNAKKED